MRRLTWSGMLALGWLTLLPTAAPAQDAVANADGAVAEAVDYADIDNWLCHPENEIDVCDHDVSASIVGADGSVEIEAWPTAAAPEVDCFYVYPTTSLDAATFADLHPGRHEELITVFTQFARFKSVCRLFAPIYRQITISGLLTNAGNLADNVQQNYLDVANAFRHYLAQHNNGRGFVLVGHSQGTSLLTELIRNEIDGQALQDQLVSAILAGNSVVVPKGGVVGGSFNAVPLCETAEQIGCVISYASYRDDVPPGNEGLFMFGRAPDEQSEIACFNPANPGGEGELDAYLSNIGEIFQGVAPMPVWTSTQPEIGTPFVKLPGLLRARCVNDGTFHYLEVRVAGDPSDPRTNDIRGDVVLNGVMSPPWGLHLVDIALAMGDLISIVQTQAGIYAENR